ncbi:MAG: flagellar motor protein MotA [Rhodospirillales bacterium]|nr:flagellar motor protein MotA [Rhodospirillales bacterium]
MARPRRFLIRMAVFLAAVFALAAVWIAPIRNAFFANPPLNGLILGVFFLGILFNFRQVLMLYPELAWLESFRSDRSQLSGASPPRLLAPMAAMLRERSGRLTLSALATRSMLDGITARLDESRDISRYTVGLLIFLGLLGTFWGLLETMTSIRNVISGLSVGSGDVTAMFGALKKGLESPLSGMGTAFSSSLFGLAASLVLGFLDLQAGQAQNHFFNDLEDWLAGQTRLGSGLLPTEGDQSVPAYVQALLEQTAESLDNLQRTIARGEENRAQAHTALAALGTQLSTLTDHMRTEQGLMRALAESHNELKQILAKIADAGARGGAGGIDDVTRGHIRNLDLQLTKLVEETRAGREQLVGQMRNEIKLLARTIAVASDAGR